MLQDYKLGLRMLLKYPGLTLAGGLVLAIAIGVGALWYEVSGKVLSPSIPLPDGHRLVTIETLNALTLEDEPRVARDFLEWRRNVRTVEELGAFRTASRNVAAGNAVPQPTRIAEITAAAFGAAHVTPLRPVTAGPGYFDLLNRPIVAGRTFRARDWNPAARTLVVNEAFARDFARQAGGASPVGARLRYRDGAPRSGAPATEDAYEVVGVVRNVGLNPDDSGHEQPFVFHAASSGTLSTLAMIVRMRGNPAPLAARLPFIAAGVDARVLVREAGPLQASIRERDTSLAVEAGVIAAITFLVLFLSALGIFSLVSVSVSRRTREIGLRTALGASTRQVLAGILSHGVLLTGGGIASGGALLLLFISIGGGPSGRPADDLPLFTVYLAITAVVMLAACLLACIGPAGRALRINPTEALRQQ